MQSPVVIDICDWNLRTQEPSRFEYRPGLRTLSRRLAVTVLAALIAGPIVYLVGFPPGSLFKPSPTGKTPSAGVQETTRKLQRSTEKLKQSLQSTMPEDRLRKIERQLAAKRAAEQARAGSRQKTMDTIGTIASGFYWLFLAVMATLGIMAPLSTLWQRVALEPGQRQRELRVIQTGLRTRRHAVPVDAGTELLVFVQEDIHRGRGSRETYSLGWRWSVVLAEREAGDRRATLLTFWADREDSLPPRLERMTARVRMLVEMLEQSLGLTAQPPIRLRERVARRGLFRTQRTLTGTSRPVVHSQTFRSLDEVPEALRPEVDRLMSAAGPPVGQGQVRQVFRIKDSQGNDRIYHSLEDMPEEIRREFERLRRQQR